MRFWTTSFLLPLLHFATADSTSSPSKPPLPCTVISSQSGNFFDLRPLTRTPPSPSSNSVVTDWTARGHDYPANFTLNICAPVLADVSKAHAIPSGQTKNISAFYTTSDGKQYSIGSVSTAPYFRGRKLVLEYTDGSPCPAAAAGPASEASKDDKGKGYGKRTLMSHLCDRDAVKPVISFVGHANDCGYFFEVRSLAACPTVQTQALGPVSVFGIIGLVAALVYLVGGCVYQRTVMHARGWRQMPNYFVWAGIVGFFWGILENVWYKFADRLPVSRGYDRVGARRSSLESENQLIDELDEDWGDEA